MRTLRLCTFLLLTWLLAPWAWAGVSTDMHAGHATTHADLPPCPAHTAAQRLWADASVADNAEPSATPQHRQHLPCGDCAACHVVALPAHTWAVPGPQVLSAAPQGQPELGQGRLRPFELERPPRA